MTSSAHRHGAGILPILATIKLSQSCELLPLPNSCCRIYDSLEASSMARGSRYYHHSFYSVFLKSIWYYMILRYGMLTFPLWQTYLCSPLYHIKIECHIEELEPTNGRNETNLNAVCITIIFVYFLGRNNVVFWGGKHRVWSFFVIHVNFNYL